MRPRRPKKKARWPEGQGGGGSPLLRTGDGGVRDVSQRAKGNHRVDSLHRRDQVKRVDHEEHKVDADGERDGVFRPNRRHLQDGAPTVPTVTSCAAWVFTRARTMGRKSTIWAKRPPIPLISMHAVFSSFVGAKRFLT